MGWGNGEGRLCALSGSKLPWGCRGRGSGRGVQLEGSVCFCSSSAGPPGLSCHYLLFSKPPSLRAWRLWMGCAVVIRLPGVFPI